MGLLMMFPNEEDDRESLRLGVSAAFFFRLMRMQAAIMARAIAARTPPTTPPMTAPEGPPPDWFCSAAPGSPFARPAVSVGASLLVVVAAGTLVWLEAEVVGALVLELEIVLVDAPGGAFCCSLSFTHSSFPLPHEYPKGQHRSPHLGNWLVNAVVFTTASGFFEASWREMSQDIGKILWQSEFCGQQRSVVPPAREMQAWVVGQQKLPGKFAHDE